MWHGPPAPATTQVAAPYALATSNAEAVCDALAGRHVHILDRSTVNEEEKKSLARLVKELGGELTFRLLAKRGTDLCVAGSAPEKQMRGPLRAFVQRFGTEYDVLRHSWLRSCRARGRLARASPADFVHLSDKTMMERVESDGFDKCAPHAHARHRRACVPHSDLVANALPIRMRTSQRLQGAAGSNSCAQVGHRDRCIP